MHAKNSCPASMLQVEVLVSIKYTGILMLI